MLEQMVESMGVLPQALQNKPELQPHLRHVWDLFWELSESRQQGFSGVASLTLSDFLSHANLYQFNRLETQENWKLVRALDRAYKRFQAKWQEQQSAANKGREKMPRQKA